MGSFFAGVVSWLLSKSTQKFVGEIVKKLAGTDAGQTKLAEIEASARVAMKREDTAQLVAALGARTALQSAKMNWPIFWILICIMMAPPAFLLVSVALYNVFWWEHGIWPQHWAIADFPASIKPWAQQAIDWLYDPISTPAAVGTALVAGRITR